jgi:DNA polymerase-1
MTNQENKPALLIDARNALYRAIFAVKADRRHKIKYHYFIAFLRQISTWVNEHRPESVHVFWDAPRSTVWRKQIHEDYKKRPKSNHSKDIGQELSVTTKIAKQFFDNMNVRQYDRKKMEADDLIYAAVTMLHPKPCIIVSTDSDMTQIPYYFSSCQVYNPTKKLMVPLPEINPVMEKAMVGDTSDNIKGYYKVGPKTCAKLLNDDKALQEFLNEKGRGTLFRNLMLIDLSLNPRILANKMYVHKKMSSGVTFDGSKLKELAQKLKVQGFLTEYAELVPQFKKLI